MKEITIAEIKWAQNPLKLDRAFKKAKIDLNTDGTPFTEESIMAWYIKLGGNVIGKIEKKKKNADEDPDKTPKE